MNEIELVALMKVLDYLDEEKENFEEQDAEGQKNHIYNFIVILKNYRDNHPILFENLNPELKMALLKSLVDYDVIPDYDPKN